jgi:hypothetical protein
LETPAGFLFGQTMALQPMQPAMAADPAMEQEAPGGFEICIRVGPDGELSVGVEGAAAEAMEGAEPAETGYQPAKNAKEALTMALYAIKNDGQLPDMAAQNAAFDEGFNGSPSAGGDMGKMRGGM